MSLSRLEVTQFRNLEPAIVDFPGQVTGVFGANGSGKTSLLEAIYCLSTGRSFRVGQPSSMIQHGKESLLVRGRLSSGEWLAVERGTTQAIRARINQEVVTQTSSLAEALPVEVMDPTTIELLLGEPERRRRLINWGLFHVKPAFRLAWQQASRALKQRNACLRVPGSGSSREWLEVYARHGEAIHELRAQHVKDLARSFAAWLELFDWPNEVTLDYRKGWASERTLKEALLESEESDKERGFTQRGVHRADLVVRVGRHPASLVSSRGEVKMLAWLLKLAQLGLLPGEVQNQTVLLLDDFSSELDEKNGRRLAETLMTLPFQIILTSASLEAANTHWGGHLARVFHVKQGIIVETGG